MAEKRPINPADLRPNPALSPGMRIGDVLYVSGHVASNASGETVGVGDCEAQARQVFVNILSVLQAAGGDMSDIVKLTCFLIDASDYPAYSKARSEVFTGTPPASSTVIVAALVRQTCSWRSKRSRTSVVTVETLPLLEMHLAGAVGVR